MTTEKSGMIPLPDSLQAPHVHFTFWLMKEGNSQNIPHHFAGIWWKYGESVQKVFSGSGSRNLASRAVSDKRTGKNHWHWLAGKLVTDFRDFNHVHSRLNRSHSKHFCLCFSSRWKLALSVLWADMSSFCLHSILAGSWTVAVSATLNPLTGRIFQLGLKAALTGRPNFCWAQGVGRESVSMGAHTAHTLWGGLQVPFFASALWRSKFECLAHGENCGHFRKLHKQIFLFLIWRYCH